MARQIQLTSKQIRLVLEAMRDIHVYVTVDGDFVQECGLCDHVLYREEFDPQGEFGYEGIGADELFILAGEHCLSSPGAVSECEAMQALWVVVDSVATEHGIELPE